MESWRFDILSYLAGIIDGEGSISISKMRTQSGNTSHRMVLCVSNTNDKMIDWLYEKFGGSVCYRPPVGCRKKDCWAWSLQGREAEELLRVVRDYSICKREEIDVALEFRATFKLGTNQYTAPEEDIIKLREDAFLRLKALHKGQGGKI